MKLRKIIFVVGLMTILALLTSVPSVMAGGGPEPPDGATILDGEVWGSVVVYCPASGNVFAAVRVKRVVGCDVKTQALVDPDFPVTCALFDESAPLNWSLGGITFSGIVGTPFIAKVKNYKEDDQTNVDQTIDHVYSFDAQFKFWQ